MLPLDITPLPLGRKAGPFSHADWLYEIKWDGFRSLVRVDHDACKLVSRHGNEFTSFSALNKAISTELGARSVVLDGEIVCLDEAGKPNFKDLLFRKGEPRFYAFDLLWCDGEDLRYLPLHERKYRLRSIVPVAGERLLYCDHVEGDGVGLFRLACEHDLEGIVAKQKWSPYVPQQNASWHKIRNRSYSQWQGREELFEREREGNPDVQLWESCALACSAGDEGNIELTS